MEKTVSAGETIERIRDIACRVRTATERILSAELLCGIEQFPHGACLDTALVLGACFANRGVAGFKLVSGIASFGQNRDFRTHAWLLRGDLIVDITADQFDPKLGGVIVSEHSEWHRQFETRPPSSRDFRNSNDPGSYDRMQLLMRIEAYLSDLPDAKE